MTFSVMSFSQDRKVTSLTVKTTLGFDAINSTTVVAEKDTIRWTAGNLHSFTLSDTVTIVFVAPPLPGDLTLVITHAANTTVFPITWPATVKWVGGTAVNTTDASGAVDIVKFFYNGTNYYEIATPLDIK